MDEGGAWGRMAQASLRGRPRGRLSGWAGLPVDAAPTLLEGGEGPWSEGSTVLSSDDILKHKDDIMLDWGGAFTFAVILVGLKAIDEYFPLMCDISSS